MMQMTSLWIAIDHADTRLFTSVSGVDIRPEVLPLVLDMPQWGLVVSQERANEARVVPTCVGMADVRSTADLRALPVPSKPTSAIKIGFTHLPMGCAAAAAVVLAKVHTYGFVFIEPYCREPQCLAMLSRLTDFTSRDVYLKLAPDQATTDALRMSGVPPRRWVARSDGMSWGEFRERLVDAQALGASGVMAGRALWGDTVGMAQAERKTVLRERMTQIQAAFDSGA
ncbi:hypothetical protein ACFU7D_08325 [Nocardioides sp. NPDC057577]|uniref:hypothetical protein n=1 Tax=Nocardioides sp. NPDC057577 TaxID=3346171 RepID=UPI003671B1F6